MNRYAMAILLGVLITPFTVHAAYVQRGYFGFGGEYLLPGLFVLMVWVMELWKEIKEYDKL